MAVNRRSDEEHFGHVLQQYVQQPTSTICFQLLNQLETLL